jgi:long-chain fatty acid transport protein
LRQVSSESVKRKNKYFSILKTTSSTPFKIVFTLAVAATALLPESLFALGIRIADQDPAATSRGNAFAATADNPSAIYYNPAGIAQLEGENVSLGGYGVLLNSHFNNGATSLDTVERVQGIPQIYFTAKCPKYPISFGLGLYSPYGLALEWPMTAPFIAIAQKGNIQYLTINPVIAYQPHPTLSLAIGPTINYGDAELRSFPGAPFRFHGDDTDIGFNAGILWQPWTQHSFGVTYRSATDMNFSGHVNSVFPASTSGFRFPRNIVFAYSFRPTTNWNFEFDADWTDWDNLNTVTLNGVPPPNNKLPFNWRSSWFYEFGATRYLNNGWSVSGGYIYSENSVPNSSFNPIVPDSDRHIFSIGVGKKYNHLSWNAGYQFAWGPSRTVFNTTIPSALANGTYEFTSHAITVNVGYHF